MENKSSHPLENVFDVDPVVSNTPTGSYPTPLLNATVDLMEPELTPPTGAIYDQRDLSIDGQLDEIQQRALHLANAVQQGIEYAEPKYLPRLGEVAIIALNAALDAVKQKADIKKHKDKLSGSSVTAIHTTTNNTLVVSRSELLRQSVAE